jgi:hypothetical protein
VKSGIGKRGTYKMADSGKHGHKRRNKSFEQKTLFIAARTPLDEANMQGVKQRKKNDFALSLQA